MTEFIESLSSLEQFFGACAVLGGLLLIIRVILQFVGGDADTDADVADGADSIDTDITHADADASFTILSFQGLTGFFMMFGLVGLALSKQSKVEDYWAIIGGFIAGSITLFLIAKMFSGMKKLQSDGTLKMSNAVGAEGTVYLRIPAEGTGKVQVTIQGSLKVFDAMSEDKQELKTGDPIKVVRVVSGDILSVRKI